jgi:hypothetical protein
MKIINKYHDRLTFDEEGFNFSIGPNEVKEVDYDTGRKLLNNFWIKEFKEIKKVEEVKKIEEVVKIEDQKTLKVDVIKKQLN